MSAIKLHVWGDYACYTRPEMKVERVSYDVMTPSAARGILEAIYWKPAIRWEVKKIHVLKPIRFANFRRNEVRSKIPVGSVKRAMASGNLGDLRLIANEDRVQRSSMILRDVAYVIEADFSISKDADPADNYGKHAAIFERRAAKGQCYHRPCLGTREFVAEFALVDGEMPASELPESQRNQDLGFMLLDFVHYPRFDPTTIKPKYFRAKLDDGAVHVPPIWSVEAFS